MNIKENLSANVQLLMQQRGYRSQADLARAAGISFTHMSVIIRALKYATIDMLDKLAHALEVEPWQLLLPPAMNNDADLAGARDVLTNYLLADRVGQETVRRVAESQANFHRP